MEKYEYNCVEVPETFGGNNKNLSKKITSAYTEIINTHAKDNWEYVGIDTTTFFYRPNLLIRILRSIPILGAFFSQDESISLKMIVFKRDKNIIISTEKNIEKAE